MYLFGIFALISAVYINGAASAAPKTTAAAGTGGPTTAPATTQYVSTEPPDFCNNHGQITCACHFGYNGTRCDKEIDWCAEGVNIAGEKPTTVGTLCQPYGKCVSEPSKGARCQCDDGFEGDFCDKAIAGQILVSHRCLLYNTTAMAAQSPPVECPYDPANFRCVPEDLRCFVEPCSDPIGWCMPVKVAKSLHSAAINDLKNR